MMAAPVTGFDEAAWWRRVLPWWHVAMAATVVLTAVLTLTAGASPWVLAPLAGLAAADVVRGAPALGRRDVPLRATSYVVLAAVALACSARFHPAALFLLACLYPHAFAMFERVRAAVLAATGVTVAASLALADRGGWSGDAVGGSVVTAVINLTIALVLGLFVTSLVRESDRRADLLHQLTTAQAELAAAHHEAGVRAERDRLSREIHDTLAQGFTSILVLVRALDATLPREAGDAATQQLALLERTAQDNLAEARALVAASPPAELAGDGLPGALERVTDRAARECGVRAAFQLGGSPRSLPAAYDVVLLRVAQEALANVTRHARATTVDVTLTYDATTTLEVSDDGCGLGSTAAGVGYGLAGMRARVEAVGGTVAVNARDSGGTSVRVSLP